MTLAIELTPEQEAQLFAFAKHEGVDVATVISKILDDHLPPLSPEAEQARREEALRELIAETEQLGLYE